MLKLTLASLFILAGSAPALAQTSEGDAAAAVEARGAAPATIGWYVAPTVGFTSINGSFGDMAGLRAAVMLNRRVGVGVAGNLMGTRYSRLGGEHPRDIGGYGGLYLQYALAGTRAVHVYADATLGAGSWCASGVGDDCHARDFFVVEPTANVELGLSRNVKLAGGVGYRLAAPGDGLGLSSGRLSGIVGRVSVVLGTF